MSFFCRSGFSRRGLAVSSLPVSDRSRNAAIAAILFGAFLALGNHAAGGDDAAGRDANVNADVLFDFDESAVTSKGAAVLAETAEELRETAEGATVSIDGHTDSLGSDAYNQELSEQRAAAVEKVLSDELSDADIDFESAGHGADRPVARNEISGADNPGGRAMNRRVEITVS